MVELKRIEQEGRTIEKFVQDFKRITRGSGYKRCLLIEKFKQGINGMIRRRLMEVENQPGSIEQWFKRTIALDRNWRKSRREEERLRRKKESNGAPAPKLNNQERQILLQLQVWQRRQEISPQQVTTGSALMEGMERMNTVMVRP